MKEALLRSASLRFGLGLNILTGALTVAAFAPLAPGTGVRPMAWASAVFAIAFLGLALGAWLLDVDKSRVRAREAFWGFVLCLSPLPLALLLFKLFVLMKSLRVLP